MKLIDIDKLPAQKIENRNGLFQKDIVDGKSTDATHFTFHLSHMDKGGSGKLHSHPHSEHLLMVVAGELEVRNGGEAHRVTPGKAILVMPGEEHEIVNQNDGPSTYYVVYAPPR